MDDMVTETYKLVRRALQDGKLMMIFGGDHSVPNGAWNALEYLCTPSDVTILHFDGHLDLRDKLDGFEYSHACIMRRARDKGFRVLHVGPRDHISAEESRYVKRGKFFRDIYFCPTQPQEFYAYFEEHIKKTKIIDCDNLLWNGESTTNQLMNLEDKIAQAKHLWLSIDVDGLDASDIPGTGTPLPLGLTRYGMRRILYRALQTARDHDVHVAGFDINEVAPQLKKEGPYSPLNTVSILNEMDAALLAYNILFWHYMDRFHK